MYNLFLPKNSFCKKTLVFNLIIFTSIKKKFCEQDINKGRICHLLLLFTFQILLYI